MSWHIPDKKIKCNPLLPIYKIKNKATRRQKSATFTSLIFGERINYCLILSLFCSNLLYSMTLHQNELDKTQGWKGIWLIAHLKNRCPTGWSRVEFPVTFCASFISELWDVCRALTVTQSGTMKLLLGFLLYLFVGFSAAKPSNYSQCIEDASQTLYSFSTKYLNGSSVSLKHFQGQVTLVLNVATFWGFAIQYPHLNALMKKFSDGKYKCGFTILAFPCNQFHYQEPGANAREIMNGLKYVRPGGGFEPNFPLFQKIQVNGAQEDPIYTFVKVTFKYMNAIRQDDWDFIGREVNYAYGFTCCYVIIWKSYEIIRFIWKWTKQLKRQKANEVNMGNMKS